MYQKDYILRMLEMLGDFIAAIFARIKKKDFKEASEMLENSYQSLLRTDASFFYNIPVGALTTTLIEDHHYTNGHLEILSELLLAEGELRFAEQKWDKSQQCFQKSSLLMEFLEQDSKSHSISRQLKLAAMSRKMEEIKTKGLLN
jgi:hypothetical protein